MGSIFKRWMDSQAGRVYFLLDADYFERRNFFRRHLAGERSRLVDLGGGRGIWSRELMDGREEVVLVDHEMEGYEGSLDRARRRLQAFSAFRAVDADVMDCKLPGATFDRVLCTEVIEHVPDPAGLVREMARLLAPGGRAVLTTPSSEFLSKFSFPFTKLCRHLPAALQNNYVRDGFEEHFRKAAGHLVLGYSVEQLSGYAQEAGLRVVHTSFVAHGLMARCYDFLNCLPAKLTLLLTPLTWVFWLLEKLIYRADQPGIGVLMVLEKPGQGKSA